MIRIQRSDPPAILLGKGKEATDLLCQSHEESPHDFDPKFNSKLYQHETVKSALIAMQHKKCAFCEASFLHVDYGDVEHFRPKAAYQKTKNGRLMRPGYYWLVYTWSNLFVSCTICNQSHKGNLFPLKNERRRARNHKAKLDQEEPLLNDPSQVDPTLHIGFREEYAFALDGSAERAATIDALGLNREELVESRRYVLENLKTLLELIRCNQANWKKSKSLKSKEQFEIWTGKLRSATKPESEYSAMATTFATLAMIQSRDHKS